MLLLLCHALVKSHVNVLCAPFVLAVVGLGQGGRGQACEIGNAGRLPAGVVGILFFGRFARLSRFLFDVVVADDCHSLGSLAYPSSCCD